MNKDEISILSKARRSSNQWSKDPTQRGTAPITFIYQRFTKYLTDWNRYRRFLVGSAFGLQPSYVITRQLFIRSLAIIYGIAFISLWIQIDGLIGSHGILPIQPFLSAIWSSIGILGLWQHPTLSWISAADWFLHAQCGLGVFFALMVCFGIAQMPALICLWILYLSLSTVARTFLGYQWDALLLETGFLSIFFISGKMWPSKKLETPPSLIIVWLFRWLLFRLMFSSGVVKLNSGDESWRTLTALNYHYETQPIPNGIAWFVHQFPEWIHSWSVVGTFAIELIIPFFIFAPRRLRLVAFVFTVFFQLLILATGNFCFFNLLSLSLCILLLDDYYWLRSIPKNWRPAPPKSLESNLLSLGVSFGLAFLLLPLSWLSLKPRVFKLNMSPFETMIYRLTIPFSIVNGYGLFADMTETRPELIIEGSQDQKTWKPYDFHWKPGDVYHPPRQIAPHQPRVDWQMWFEALNYERDNKPTYWFRAFLSRILEGEQAVLDLLKSNPFPTSPPAYIRVRAFQYEFTTKEEKANSKAWWKRKFLGIYVPPSSLRR